jgi:UPF0716 protein FxsA
MTPFHFLFLLFLLVPVIEIYLLIQVGGVIGAFPTILLVILTALLGAVLLRFQGLATLQRVQMAMARGELPTMAMFEGVVLLISGALLLTPGFFTDAIGFAGLIPPLRRKLIKAFIKHTVDVGVSGFGTGTSSPEQRGPRTLEGEFRREDD